MHNTLLIKTLLTGATLCSVAMFLPGASRSGQGAGSAAAGSDFTDDLGARFLMGQEPSPAAMPMPIPVVRPEIHPRIHVHAQEPAIDIDRDEETDHDIDIEHEDMDHDVDVDHEKMDHDEADFDFDHDNPELNVRAEEKFQKTFAMPAAHRTLEIDNVWGSIEVVGTSANEVQLTVNKSLRAESKEKLEEARKKVTIDITEQPDTLKLYVNGPFRCNCNDGCGHRDFEGYIVKMDFQIQVPRDTDIKIKTVNEGRVSVREIHGTFLVRNVNGDIQMHNIAGSGTARTVNGPVKVSFRQNPTEASDFQTVNGAVELQFAKNLAADFRFKTMNGAIYSDFPASALPVSGMQQEHHGAKVIFRADRYTGARIGSGGPQIKVENLNGDIRILENHE
jgi:hypothetical protein